MKIAILGAGTIVPDFLEAAGQLPEVEIEAIFGRTSSRQRMKELKNQYSIHKISYDYDELLADPDLDAVYVALPNHLHCTFAEQAIRQKKHVIVEKPFAGSYGQATELIELAEKHKVIVFEAISNQYMPNYSKTRELLGEIGTVKIVQLNYSQYSRRYDLFRKGTVLPVFDPKQSGGALMDLNVYNIHYIVGLFGRPEAVHYIANIEKGIDTSGILTLQYPDFQCVSIGAKDCKAPTFITIQGEEGYLHSDEPANGYGTFGVVRKDREAELFALNKRRPRLYYELKTFLDLVMTKDFERARQYSRQTLLVMEILDEARRQIGINF